MMKHASLLLTAAARVKTSLIRWNKSVHLAPKYHSAGRFVSSKKKHHISQWCQSQPGLWVTFCLIEKQVWTFCFQGSKQAELRDNQNIWNTGASRFLFLIKSYRLVISPWCTLPLTLWQDRLLKWISGWRWIEAVSC